MVSFTSEAYSEASAHVDKYMDTSNIETENADAVEGQ